MKVNPKNDVIVPASASLHWLGHRVTAQKSTVDLHTTRSILNKLNPQNVASYRSLMLKEQTRAELDWLILEKILDT